MQWYTATLTDRDAIESIVGVACPPLLLQPRFGTPNIGKNEMFGLSCQLKLRTKLDMFGIEWACFPLKKEDMLFSVDVSINPRMTEAEIEKEIHESIGNLFGKLSERGTGIKNVVLVPTSKNGIVLECYQRMTPPGFCMGQPAPPPTCMPSCRPGVYDFNPSWWYQRKK